MMDIFVNIITLTDYLIESLVTVKLNEGEQGNADDGTEKPLRKGRSLLSSNFVENVTDNADEHHYYASAHVHHSMKNEKPLHVIITISKASGGIMKAKCTCRVHTLERCCHIAAVLLMLSDFVATNGCRVIKPSTSLPCVWNKGQKRKKDPKALHLATRWQHITASTCKVVLSYRKRICKSEPLNCQNFLWQKLWSTDNESSADMLYGINGRACCQKKIF